jgi:hypothetical protein
MNPEGNKNFNNMNKEKCINEAVEFNTFLKKENR